MCENRRDAIWLRSRMDEILETLADLEALPSEGTDARALQEAVQAARPHIATINAVLDRMERGKGQPTTVAPGADPPTGREG